MGKGFLHGIALRLFLQIVVADDRRAAYGFLQVSVFQRAEEGALVVAPHSGVEIGLQLDAHAHPVGVGLAHTCHLAVGLVQGTQHVLHVVTYLVGNHIGVGEVTVGPQLLPHAGEEGKVYVQLFVGAAVEGAHGRLSLPAGGGSAAGVQHQGGGFVGAQVVVQEILAPYVFGGSQDLAGELGQGFVLGRGLVVGLYGRG